MEIIYMNNNYKEEWKDIPNYEGLYQASNFGRIKGLDRWAETPTGEQLYLIKEKILITYFNKNGLEKINLYKFGKPHCERVDRLVAMAWVDNPDRLPTVVHKDGNIQNCNSNNLYWERRNTTSV